MPHPQKEHLVVTISWTTAAAAAQQLPLLLKAGVQPGLAASAGNTVDSWCSSGCRHAERLSSPSACSTGGPAQTG